MERDQAVRLTQNLLKKMVENNGSDLFITADFPPAIKIDGAIKPFADRPLTSAQSSLIVRSIMNDKQAKEFDCDQGVQLRDRAARNRALSRERIRRTGSRRRRDPYHRDQDPHFRGP